MKETETATTATTATTLHDLASVTPQEHKKQGTPLKIEVKSGLLWPIGFTRIVRFSRESSLYTRVSNIRFSKVGS